MSHSERHKFVRKYSSGASKRKVSTDKWKRQEAERRKMNASHQFFSPQVEDIVILPQLNELQIENFDIPTDSVNVNAVAHVDGYDYFELSFKNFLPDSFECFSLTDKLMFFALLLRKQLLAATNIPCNISLPVALHCKHSDITSSFSSLSSFKRTSWTNIERELEVRK